jgi:hypothetical protein
MSKRAFDRGGCSRTNAKMTRYADDAAYAAANGDCRTARFDGHKAQMLAERSSCSTPEHRRFIARNLREVAAHCPAPGLKPMALSGPKRPRRRRRSR